MTQEEAAKNLIATLDHMLDDIQRTLEENHPVKAYRIVTVARTRINDFRLESST